MVLSQKLSVYKTLSFLCNLDIEKYTMDWRVRASFSQCVNLVRMIALWDCHMR